MTTSSFLFEKKSKYLAIQQTSKLRRKSSNKKFIENVIAISRDYVMQYIYVFAIPSSLLFLDLDTTIGPLAINVFAMRKLHNNKSFHVFTTENYSPKSTLQKCLARDASCAELYWSVSRFCPVKLCFHLRFESMLIISCMTVV